ncbi:hypothetical protein [Pseudorhodoplanes sp.]|uniref:hypothetical protein n=1 Tax=Pseudorhodoplanes sp. TaxID=1934341 RepID=UPI002C706A7D|nr:hypothetical protein [Pseudorhodoplanes sp.]HWV54361.1 hypothetical protein [Pseudorhodoplanes sp.]
MTVSFAVAPNFQLKGSWTDRLLVAEGDGWRAANADEVTALTLSEPPEGGDACACLFTVPMHLRGRFWMMLDQEAVEGSGDFVSFSYDLAEFLRFKQLPLPNDSVCELLLQDAAGQLTTDDVWALVNFGEDPVELAWPQLRLRLNSGEGVRMASGSTADVVPPANDDLNVLLAICLATA